jgi:hypothetical protein
MAGDWFVAYGTNHNGPCVSFLGCYLVHTLECELEIVAPLAIEDRECVSAHVSGQAIAYGGGRKQHCSQWIDDTLTISLGHRHAV